uniref:Uncharacterized protein n=1 Tax=Zea mays TaxID=4577 RepID=A0A804LMQ9_MAIZE
MGALGPGPGKLGRPGELGPRPDLARPAARLDRPVAPVPRRCPPPPPINGDEHRAAVCQNSPELFKLLRLAPSARRNLSPKPRHRRSWYSAAPFCLCAHTAGYFPTTPRPQPHHTPAVEPLLALCPARRREAHRRTVRSQTGVTRPVPDHPGSGPGLPRSAAPLVPNPAAPGSVAPGRARPTPPRAGPALGRPRLGCPASPRLAPGEPAPRRSGEPPPRPALGRASPGRPRPPGRSGEPPPPSRARPRRSAPPRAVPAWPPAFVSGSAASRRARPSRARLNRPRRAPARPPAPGPGLARPCPRPAVSSPRRALLTSCRPLRGLELGPVCLWRAALSSASVRPRCAHG